MAERQIEKIAPRTERYAAVMAEQQLLVLILWIYQHYWRLFYLWVLKVMQPMSAATIPCLLFML